MADADRWMFDLIDGEWSLKKHYYGWKNQTFAKKIVPVMTWPDGNRIVLCESVHYNCIVLIHFPPPLQEGQEDRRPITPPNVTINLAANRFARQTLLHDLGVETLSYLFTFISMVGIPLENFQEDGRHRSCTLRERYVKTGVSTESDVSVHWIWIEGGRFELTDNNSVELDVLLGNRPPWLLPFRDLEPWVLAERGQVEEIGPVV